MLLDLLYSEDIDIKDLEKYFLASSQGQAPGFSPKNLITGPVDAPEKRPSVISAILFPSSLSLLIASEV